MDFKILLIVVLFVTVSLAEERDDKVYDTTLAPNNTSHTTKPTSSSSATKRSDSVILPMPNSTSDNSTDVSNTSDNSTAQNSNANESTMASVAISDTSTQNSSSDSSSTPTPSKIDTSDTSTKIESSTDNDQSINGLECKQVGRFPHPSSCTKYFYCWDNSGLAFEFNCPEHRAFDPISQHCVVNYGVCAHAPKCNNHKQILTNPDDKWSFFECFLKQNESKEFELQCKPCADHRVYDDKFGYCKLASANGEMILDSDEFIDDSICSETGLVIDYEDDTKYYECVVKSVAKGLLKAIHHKCPMFHVFSMQDQKCVPLSILTKPKH